MANKINYKKLSSFVNLLNYFSPHLLYHNDANIFTFTTRKESIDNHIKIHELS